MNLLKPFKYAWYMALNQPSTVLSSHVELGRFILNCIRFMVGFCYGLGVSARVKWSTYLQPLSEELWEVFAGRIEKFIETIALNTDEVKAMGCQYEALRLGIGEFFENSKLVELPANVPMAADLLEDVDEA